MALEFVALLIIGSGIIGVFSPVSVLASFAVAFIIFWRVGLFPNIYRRIMASSASSIAAWVSASLLIDGLFSGTQYGSILGHHVVISSIFAAGYAAVFFTVFGKDLQFRPVKVKK
jgi:hypothetical protein